MQILLNQLQNKWVKKNVDKVISLANSLKWLLVCVGFFVDSYLFLCVEAECMFMCGG